MKLVKNVKCCSRLCEDKSYEDKAKQNEANMKEAFEHLLKKQTQQTQQTQDQSSQSALPVKQSLETSYRLVGQGYDIKPKKKKTFKL